MTLTVTQSDGLTGSMQHVLTVGPAALPASGPPSTGSLSQGLIPPHSATKITNLLKKGEATSVVSAPSASGTITITWYATVKHHRIVVARGSASVRAGVAAHITVRLSAAGRALLRRSTRVRITISGVYTAGGSSVTVTGTITLRH